MPIGTGIRIAFGQNVIMVYVTVILILTQSTVVGEAVKSGGITTIGYGEDNSGLI